MKYTITAVLAIATFAIIMTSTTSAFAQSTPNVHAVDPVPGGGVPNTLFQMQSVQAALDGSVPDNTNIIAQRIMVIYDPDLGALIPQNPNNCVAYTVQPGDRLWALRNTATQTPITSQHIDVRDALSTILWDSTALAGNGFGNGANPAILSVSGSASISGANANPLLNNWVELNSAGNVIANSFDSTAQPGQYSLVACGFVDLGPTPDGIWQTNEPISVEIRSFSISSIVGGEMIPISTASLLVAGASANALWILPILGLAGTIIAIRKLEA